jgi:aryl-alcohol dehydrogenase-like predicted oxidoreductase
MQSTSLLMIRHAQMEHNGGGPTTRLCGWCGPARKANRPIVDLVRGIAAAKKATPAQIALAWLLAQKPWIVPIPGTRKPERLDENLGALDVRFTADERSEIDRASSGIQLQGARGCGTEQYL